jgi:hypothetical protein
VRTATMDIILTPARLTAFTDLTGFRAECLSAPARGLVSASVEAFSEDPGSSEDVGSPVGVGSVGVGLWVDVDSLVDAGSPGAVGSLVDVDLREGRLVGSTAALAVDFTVAAASTVVVGEDSTAAVVDMAADTGNHRWSEVS